MKNAPSIGAIGNNAEVEALEKAGLVFWVDEPKIVLRAIHAVNHKFIYERLIEAGYTDRKKAGIILLFAIFLPFTSADVIICP